ncbi:hypothetical protein SLEP1_g44638 [Rubroshorea leprosula]|uniref:Uncharacterized protein n=1 Tax=Rubroshorea leprosula TaxID=152421 RepID=A0AAV5LGU2_9ROSI|nr:hypothetical protein SLEP1_g44638 [Rubroshorea leprosula]
MMVSRPFDDDGYIGYDPRPPSQRFDSCSNFDVGSVKDSPLLETPSPPPIGGGSGGFSKFSAEENGKILTAVFW